MGTGNHESCTFSFFLFIKTNRTPGHRRYNQTRLRLQEKNNTYMQIPYQFFSLYVAVSDLLLPFTAGKSNGLLRPACPAVRGTAPVPGLHHKAPTQGCTFQPTMRVTFSRSAILPEMSVIWYFDFWLRRCKMPGVSACFLDDGFCCFSSLLLFFLDVPQLVLLLGKKRSFRAGKE